MLFFQQKKCLLRFFISRSKSLSPFFSLSFAGLPPTFSFSPSLALYSKFVDMTIYLSLNFRQHGYRDSFRFPFSSLLTLLLSLLYKTPARVAFGFPYLLIELFYIGMTVVRTDGLSGGRAVHGHVITKFSRMGRLLHFLTHGAPP